MRLTNLPVMVLLLLPAACTGGTGGTTGPDNSLARLEVASGNAQTAEAGASLAIPVVIRAVNSAASPLSGVTITATVTGGGSLNSSSAVTGADGRASFAWTLGATQGTQTLSAGSGSVTATVTATATRPAVADIHLDFTTVLLDLAATAQGTAVAVDARGNPVPGATITWTAPPGGTVTLSATTGSPITITGAVIGGENLTATSEGVSRQAGFTVVRGTFVQVDGGSGGNHMCGRTAPGVVFCWGNNASGALGDGTTTNRAVPTRVAGNILFAEVDAGGFTTGRTHTCARTAAGAVYCWGKNDNGQLGDGTTTDRPVPTLVSGGIVFANISVGGLHTCARTSAGAAYCWGFNGSAGIGGALGDGTNTARSTPTPVVGGIVFAEIAAGSKHSTCGRTAAGVGYCWGLNQDLQLGIGNNPLENPSVPTPMVGGLTIAGFALGQGNGCARTTGGQTYCWGFNLNGALGDGTTTNTGIPVLVASAQSFVQVVMSQLHTCGITANGSAYCWGANANNRLGDGTDDDRKTTPSAVVGGINFVSISASVFTTCGRTASGQRYCWGGNGGTYGYTDGTTTNSPVPVLVP